MIRRPLLHDVRSAVRAERLAHHGFISRFLLVMLGFALMPGIAFLMASDRAGDENPGLTLASSPASGALVYGTLLALRSAMIVVADFEYGTVNLILLAAPKRHVFYVGKLIDSLSTALLVLVASLFVSAAMVSILWADPWYAVLGSSSFWWACLVAMSLCSALVCITHAIAFVVRSSLGSLVLVTGLFVLPSLVRVLIESRTSIPLGALDWVLPGSLLGTIVSAEQASASALLALGGLAAWSATLSAVSLGRFRESSES